MTVARVQQTVTYPARFMLIASMNPCPCGNYGSTVRECKCTATQIRNYLAKLSGPLLDRIDLHVEVDGISYEQMQTRAEGEHSQTIRERVNKARNIQAKRFEGTPIHCNAQMSSRQMNEFCRMDDACERLMRAAFDKLQLSARAYTRILKVARTIADLNGEEKLNERHIAEAIQYRSLDRKYGV